MSVKQQLLLGGMLSLMACGCSIPIHQQPQGFSSTYHNALYGGDVVAAPLDETQVWYPTTDLASPETLLQVPEETSN